MSSRVQGGGRRAGQRRRSETIDRRFGGPGSTSSTSMTVVGVYVAGLVNFLLPTWAWKPVLMALTDRLDPHDWQVIKYRRFSFDRSVSGDLQILQVTYSTAATIHVLAELEPLAIRLMITHQCTASTQSQSAFAGIYP